MKKGDKYTVLVYGIANGNIETTYIGKTQQKTATQNEVHGFKKIIGEGILLVTKEDLEDRVTPVKKVFQNTEFPTQIEGEQHSVDVIVYAEENMLNVGFYQFAEKKWLFHTDTLQDPYENNELMDFVWMYKPDYLTQINPKNPNKPKVTQKTQSVIPNETKTSTRRI